MSIDDHLPPGSLSCSKDDLEPEKAASNDATPQPNMCRSKYESEWRQLSAGVEEVRRRALTGALRACRLRSLAWAQLLGILPDSSDDWLTQIRQNRHEYAELKKKLSCDPRCCELPEDNPLSQKDESMWNQHFCDTELQTVIKLDVVRTFPGLDFFKQPEIQEAMVNVLFCFARETPRLVYRQGMHEILAPLLFVLQSDHRAAEHSSPGEMLAEIMSPDYLEHDSYVLFRAVMKGIESFYRLNDMPQHRAPHVSKTDKSSKQPLEPQKKENEVVKQLATIRDDILIPQDPELAEHFEKCDIALSLFGIRWLRVLFGREFALHDLLVLWDAIFAEGNDFSLAGYIMVAMLIAIRAPLLSSDPMVCLTHLMHYPSAVDVQYIIDHALKLKHPRDYSMPASSPFCHRAWGQLAQTEHKAWGQTQTEHKHQKHRIAKEKVRSIPKSDPIPKIKVSGGTEDKGIIDGFTLQEPEILREELFHAHSVMSLCQLKLEQYEEVLHQALPSSLPASHPAYQALGGIRELCNLLKSRYHAPPVVEAALEANEKPTRAVKTEGPQEKATPVENARHSSKRHPNKPVLPISKEVQLKVFNLVENPNAQVQGAPNLDPLGLRSD